MTLSCHRATVLASALASMGLVPVTGAADDTARCAQDEYAMGLRYQQQSAEVEALQRQSYALATYRLRDQLEAHDGGAGLAIITDLDETVIDNSALLVRDMQACHDFTTWDTWKHWEREGAPRLIPGAREFLNYADDHGVAIYYVSDRYEENKSATLATLTALDLPQVSDQRVKLLGPPKSERRDSVAEAHTLVMQLGDSLHDFSEQFAGTALAEQRDIVGEQADHFGDDWIVFPNATYGSWSSAELTPWQADLEAP